LNEPHVDSIRLAFRAALAAAALLVALAACAAVAHAGGGGGFGTGTATGPAQSDPAEPSPLNQSAPKYDRLWSKVTKREKRWAKTTAECESGRDPDAIGGGGTYRGAFQFMRSTWRTSPRSPGGDPTAWNYRTQAVVAVSLKREQGTAPWPVCG
jgi:hypothetical protein